jgi:ribulose-phosphate 3-epimerase
MSVNPGFSGQVFLPEVLSKVSQVREMLIQHNPDALLEIDGGINTETLPLALNAGAQVYVVATAVFRHPQGISAGINALKALLPVN